LEKEQELCATEGNRKRGQLGKLIVLMWVGGESRTHKPQNEERGEVHPKKLKNDVWKKMARGGAGKLVLDSSKSLTEGFNTKI